MEQDYTIGAFAIENLTSALYPDSKVIYREYLQNAADQIDKAVSLGILKKGEGVINIWLDKDKRAITIQDNATGIKQSEFRTTLGDVANSDKRIGQNKGFRGIGRLCGLAFCRQLVFTSTYRGESVISKMNCNAAKMRELISEHAEGKKHTANDVLKAINKFEFIDSNAATDEHYFCVELIGINEENFDLLDKDEIRAYLEFVAPVPYQSAFIYRSDIYKHAKEIGQRIDEYKVKLDGSELFKQYKTHMKTRQGLTEVYGIEFKEFYSNDGNLLMWLWYGKTRVPGAMNEKDTPMRCIRLRKDNIQVGNEETLRRFFGKNDNSKFHSYFIGEIFAVSKELVPDSSRDYFNEKAARVEFEQHLRDYFQKVLSPLCRVGSDLNVAYRKIDTFQQRNEEFTEKEQRRDFVDSSQRKEELEKVTAAKQDAEEAQKQIEKLKERGGIPAEIISRIENERSGKKDIEFTLPEEKYDDKSKPKNRSDKLDRLSRSERKLVSRIYGVIFRSTDNKTAEAIVKNIEEELK